MLGCARTSFLSLLVLIAASASAQWSDDAALNIPFGDGAGDQVVPHAVILADGSCYVGWYDNASGNYDVRLQFVDPTGKEQWAHGGILVSGHPQDSWVMDRALLATSDGDAVVAFADIRGGGSNIHVYRIDADGVFVWGPDGLDVTADTDGKGPPSLGEAADGDVVVAWPASPASGSPALKMQRYAPDGTPRFAAGGVVVSEVADAYPVYAHFAPCGDHDLVMGYVPTYSYMANRQVKAVRLDASGAPVWAASLMIMDDGTIPMGHDFEMAADGAGGAWFGWTKATGLSFAVLVQHVDALGVESFAHNGLSASVDATWSRISPDLALDPATGELTVGYARMTSDQNQRGVDAQRFAADTGRLWGDDGVSLLPVDHDMEDFVRVVDRGDGPIVLCFQAPGGAYGQDLVLGCRLDAAGATVWDPAVMDVSSTGSGKDDLVAIIGPDGAARAFWSDDRSGSDDIYGQNLNPDGTLGPVETAVPEVPAAAVRLERNRPNPFNPSTEIAFALDRRERVVLAVYDAAGRRVRTLFAGEAGPGAETVRWDGRDDAGADAPSGVYLCRLATRLGVRSRSIALVR